MGKKAVSLETVYWSMQGGIRREQEGFFLNEDLEEFPVDPFDL